ncbi:acylphosphatase [Novilysobacter defluvii]
MLAAGESAAIDALAAWLRSGPPAARVEALERVEADPREAGSGFEVL